MFGKPSVVQVAVLILASRPVLRAFVTVLEAPSLHIPFFFFFINPIYRAKRVSKLHVREDALVYI